MMNQETCLLLLQITTCYFASINIFYGLLMFFSWLKIKRFVKENAALSSEVLPPVSFIIPAFNEEALIVETIQTYLSLSQIKKEIIVINDGSHDKTMDLLKNMFQLQKQSDKMYRSITWPELKVLEAPHVGKAEALNLGIFHSEFGLICTMDADTIPAARGVEAALRSFAKDPKTVAVGGVIQVLKGQNLHSKLTSFQRLEYLRTFICERLGWSYLGSTLLISGAFCMLKKEALQKVGGFSHRSITEDLDLIVKLRRAYRGEHKLFKVLPVTTCYTQVPKSMRHLMFQRIRWQLGLIQTLSQNLGLVFNPRHKALGLFAIPYFWLVEVASPILEVMALVLIPYAMYMEWIRTDIVSMYLGIGLVFNLFITLIGVYADNKYVSKNAQWSYLKSFFDTALMHFGYKQTNSWWRLIALSKSFKKNATWGDKPREEINPLSL